METSNCVRYLKDRASLVEAWWTHDPAKRECACSAVVASLPGVSVSASVFGSNECTRRAAHLYRFARRPSFRRFAAAVARSGTRGRVERISATAMEGSRTNREAGEQVRPRRRSSK